MCGFLHEIWQLDDPVGTVITLAESALDRTKRHSVKYRIGRWLLRLGSTLLVVAPFLPWLAVPSGVVPNTFVTNAFGVASVYGHSSGILDAAEICIICSAVAFLLGSLHAFSTWASKWIGVVMAATGLVALGVAISGIPILKGFTPRGGTPLVGIEPVGYGVVIAIAGALCIVFSGLILWRSDAAMGHPISDE